jgi:hypothetical protein
MGLFRHCGQVMELARDDVKKDNDFHGFKEVAEVVL